jgi:TRAP-type C4-dicarboxylate transport system substrate-binding protein
MAKINDDNKAQLIAAGMTSIEFEPAFYDTLIEKSKAVYDAVRAEIGNELVESLMSELEKAK